MPSDSENLTMHSKPECPECPDDAEYSVTKGQSTKTLMATIPAKWDDDGNHHPMIDPNKIQTTYRCSNGHSWTESRRADPRYEAKMERRREAGLRGDDDGV